MACSCLSFSLGDRRPVCFDSFDLLSCHISLSTILLRQRPFTSFDFFNQSKKLVLWAITCQIIFCTIVLFINCATYDKPLQFYKFADILIYRLVKLYLYNLKAYESSWNLKQWIRSYYDHKIMSLTSNNYNPDHYIKLSTKIYKKLLVKINKIEFVLFFSTIVWSEIEVKLINFG